MVDHNALAPGTEMKKTNIDMIDNAMLYLVLVVKAKHLLPLSREDDEECLKSLDEPFSSHHHHST